MLDEKKPTIASWANDLWLLWVCVSVAQIDRLVVMAARGRLDAALYDWFSCEKKSYTWFKSSVPFHVRREPGAQSPYAIPTYTSKPSK